MSKRTVLLLFAGLVAVAALLVWFAIVPSAGPPTLPEIGPGVRRVDAGKR